MAGPRERAGATVQAASATAPELTVSLFGAAERQYVRYKVAGVEIAVVRSLRGLALRLLPGSARGENAHQIASQDGVAVVVPTVEFGK